MHQQVRTRLIVISLDGMRPDFYRRPDELGVKVPNLRKLVKAGASAEAVESIYPSTTYPAHATLVTGVPPRVHGIYSHLASLDPTETARPWMWFARALDVPALWDVARAAGMKTASMGWPVSAGGPIDWNIPEIWDPAGPDPYKDFATPARHSTPGLFEEVVKAITPVFLKHPAPGHSQHKHRPPTLEDAGPDRLRTEGSLYIWRHYHPDLMLVHLIGYDHEAHEHGPFGAGALAAIEASDAEIGRFSEAAAADGNTTLVVLSDHGFIAVEREAAPLVALADEGLFARTHDGKIELRRLGAIHAGGCFALYWLDEPAADDKRQLHSALAKLQRAGAVLEVVKPEKLEALDADPDAALILEAAPGHYFSDRTHGPLVRASQKDHGTHGNLPQTPGMEAGFVVAGSGITGGKNLGRIKLTQVAPALARLLGLPAEILASQDDPLSFS